MTIDTQGNATHHTTIRYLWAKNGQVYGSLLYRDYVRIYVPPNSILQEQDGWQQRGTSQAFGRKVWEGLITLLLRPNRNYYSYLDKPQHGYKGCKRFALSVSDTAASRLSVVSRPTCDTANVCDYKQ